MFQRPAVVTPDAGDLGRAGIIPALGTLDGLSRVGSPGGGLQCVDVEGNVKRVLRATGGTKVTLLTSPLAAPQAQGPA
ncbi:uncharacterized protein LAESUDRAFT_729691 [Laetiporus sulphureus 93-53]|uniref:Uncharacterized protein n=1 Tax=Laetiporus sulphureus 93-53 TaxID=1314785 RepID=A0A165CJW0_9APHY|nr:uncharacterized protein LAESUDRAFT_729691 [Laetiporus sulphureus 93-53]KZT02945.1 hypothetical protein LAESUDRAFT_729691 [Laetiporus sulphureus 93-53]